MSTLELVGGIILLVSCVLMILLGLMQDQKQDQNMTSAITGGSYDSAFSKNEGNTKEARLKRWTTFLCVLFFVTTLVVTIVPVWFTSGGGSSAAG
ncbi:MAG: preprotein translocase subunit SecG [Oscillospiraceae bacterium]|nr:preprotein translocase subunit SecG [Oscillospiraceae bacterium]